MTILQTRLPNSDVKPQRSSDLADPQQVALALQGDLNFHGQNSAYASHSFHAFPAKFPPQLPRTFIQALTQPGDIVLDPMMGSGTTIVESVLLDRQGLDTDIDPMALRICQVKTTNINVEQAAQIGYELLDKARHQAQNYADEILQRLATRFPEAEKKFIDYWFLPNVKIELLALLEEIEQVEPTNIRAFLEMVFSAIIITKSGGVSRARDLAHTRPHRVLDKKSRSPLVEFPKRLKKNLKSGVALNSGPGHARLLRGEAQSIGLADNSVDLIVTSPPYVANAIDYMRAHKFSLVWFGYRLNQLAYLRRQYIGHDALNGVELRPLPKRVADVVSHIRQADAKKAKVLHRYYSESILFLREMLRVLKPGRAAIVVVGSSTMRGIDTQTGRCLIKIGESLGFASVGVAVRKLDRDKRMMPARQRRNQNSTQIEDRMHEEHVIAFIKSGKDKVL